MKMISYDRAAAVAYARAWALGRNPAYADFSEMGGDCTNFISQALYAGGCPMNETRDAGWYYHSLQSRAAAWTSVPFLFHFLTVNRGRGPFAHEAPLEEAAPGDIIQLKFAGAADYGHSLLVLETGAPPAPENILIAAHSHDSLDRPLNTYSYVNARLLRIGVRG